jgi:GTP-binding protein
MEEGRALVIAVNKWDLARKGALDRVKGRLEKSLAQADGVSVVPCSALTGHGMEGLLPAVLGAYEVWNKRISTGLLNRWLATMVEKNPPPVSKGRRIRLRYITQARARPPTFSLSASRAADLPDSYLRYLVKGLRRDFGLPGVPIRIHARKGKNPYAPK